VLAGELVVQYTHRDPLAVWGVSLMASDRKLQFALACTIGLQVLVARWARQHPEMNWSALPAAVGGSAVLLALASPGPSIIANRMSRAAWHFAPSGARWVSPVLAARGDSARWSDFVTATWTQWERMPAAARQEFDLGTGAPEALFAMQVAMTGWAFGNPDGRGEGCVLRNALRSRPLPLARLSADDYVRSPIACCADYVSILVALLRARGGTASVVALPGHWLVEVPSTRGPLLLDPTTGLARQERGGRRYLLAWSPPGLAAGTSVPRPALRWPRTRMEYVLANESLAWAARQRAVDGYAHINWGIPRALLERPPATR
jgi:hypothetical protein